MEQVIFKYEIPITSNFNLKLPTGSKILSIDVDEKSNTPCMWVLICLGNDEEDRSFELLVTGEYFKHNDRRTYVGSFHTHKSLFIGHVFELNKI